MKKPISKRAQQMLLRAAEVLSDQKHWVQGWKVSPRGLDDTSFKNADRVCMLGAVRKAASEMGVWEAEGPEYGLHPEIREACEALEQSLPERSRQLGYGVITYNDRSGRTHADIKAVMCQAVKDYVEPDAVTEEPSSSAPSR